jgi:hypothetical protein
MDNGNGGLAQHIGLRQFVTMLICGRPRSQADADFDAAIANHGKVIEKAQSGFCQAVEAAIESTNRVNAQIDRICAEKGIE